MKPLSHHRRQPQGAATFPGASARPARARPPASPADPAPRGRRPALSGAILTKGPFRPLLKLNAIGTGWGRVSAAATDYFLPASDASPVATRLITTARRICCGFTLPQSARVLLTPPPALATYQRRGLPRPAFSFAHGRQSSRFLFAAAAVSQARAPRRAVRLAVVRRRLS